MKIYIDSDFKCHVIGDGTMREIETDFFNGKCRDFIEGYRFVPQGETWVDEDGTAYDGEMISPCVKQMFLMLYRLLLAAHRLKQTNR